MRTRGAIAALAAAAALAAGCGGDDRSPEDTVSEVYAAIADGDFETVCSLTDESAQQSLIDQSDGAESCEDAAAEVIGEEDDTFDDVEVGEADIDGDTATVTITSDSLGETDEVGLVLEDDEWKVTGE